MREKYSMSAIDHALAGVEKYRDLAAGNLVVAVMRDRTAGQDYGALGLVHDAVFAGGPSRALTEPNVPVRDHVLHLFEVFVEIVYAQLIAGKLRVRLGSVHISEPQDRMILVIERHRLGLYIDRGLVVAELHPPKRTALLRRVRCELGFAAGRRLGRLVHSDGFCRRGGARRWRRGCGSARRRSRRFGRGTS